MTPLELAMQASVDEVLGTKRSAPAASAASASRSQPDASKTPLGAKRGADANSAEKARVTFEADLEAEAAAATVALGSLRAGHDDDDEFDYDGVVAAASAVTPRAAPAAEPAPAAPAPLATQSDAHELDAYAAELRRRSEVASALAAADQHDAARSDLRGSSASALRAVMAQSALGARAEVEVVHEAKSAAERADEHAAAQLRGGLVRLTEEEGADDEDEDEEDARPGAGALIMSELAGTGPQPNFAALAPAAAAEAKRVRDEAERAALTAQWAAVEQANAADAERARARAALPAGGRLGAKVKSDKIGFVEALACLAEQADAGEDGDDIRREDWTEAGCLPRGLPFLRPRLRGERLERERDRLLHIGKLAYADADVSHERILMSLYKALTGSERDPAAEGEHWEGVGFQGRRPSSDLRGMGMLSLLNALHLVTRRKRLAAELFALSRSERDFPFMSVSINLTKVCVDALRCGALTSAANAAGSLVEVFHELHAGLFAHMGEQWRARKLTIMNFNEILKELKALGTRKTAAMLQKARALEKGPKLDMDKASTVRNSRAILLAEKAGSEGGSETPRPPEGEAGGGSSLDWDEEWRKFNKEGGAASNWRPEGRSAYSVQELASARASRTVNEISSSLPSPSELVRDGRFWLALLVIAAVLPGLFAALSAAPRPGDVMV